MFTETGSTFFFFRCSASYSQIQAIYGMLRETLKNPLFLPYSWKLSRQPCRCILASWASEIKMRWFWYCLGERIKICKCWNPAERDVTAGTLHWHFPWSLILSHCAGQKEINPTPSDRVKRGQRVLMNLGGILTKNRYKQIKTQRSNENSSTARSISYSSKLHCFCLLKNTVCNKQ